MKNSDHGSPRQGEFRGRRYTNVVSSLLSIFC